MSSKNRFPQPESGAQLQIDGLESREPQIPGPLSSYPNAPRRVDPADPEFEAELERIDRQGGVNAQEAAARAHRNLNARPKPEDEIVLVQQALKKFPPKRQSTGRGRKQDGTVDLRTLSPRDRLQADKRGRPGKDYSPYG